MLPQITITRRDIVHDIYKETGFSQDQIGKCINLIIEMITLELIDTGRVGIKNFGVFKVHNKKERSGYNFHTNELININKRNSVKLNFKYKNLKKLTNYKQDFICYNENDKINRNNFKKFRYNLFYLIFHYLIRGGISATQRVEIRGLGVFEVRKRRAINARNPKTGEKITVPEKWVPFFKASSILKKRLNGALK